MENKPVENLQVVTAVSAIPETVGAVAEVPAVPIVQEPQAAPVAATAPVEEKPKAPDLTTSAEVEDRVLTTEEQERLFSGFPVDEKAPEEVKAPTQEEILQDLFKTVPIDPEITGVSPVPVVVEQQAQTPAPVPGEAVSPQPVPVPPVAPEVPAVQQTPAEAALTAQLQLQATNVQRLEDQVKGLMGQTPVTPQAQQAATETTPQRKFNFNIPDEYMTALASEDEGQRRLALTGLLTGVAEQTYQVVKDEMTKQMETVPQTIETFNTQREKAKEIHDDMYNAYPELRGWEAQVAATANQVASELGTTSWSPQLRDEVARRLAPLVPAITDRVTQSIASRATPQIPAVALPPGTMQPQIQPAPAPIPQHYTAVQGMPGHRVQVAPAATTPQQTLVRQPDGTVVSVPAAATPQFVAAPGTRPNGQLGVDPQVADMWATLSYT